MVTRRVNNESDIPRRPPASTPDGRENQLIALAVDVAEQQLRQGTASAQVISHYLKLGSSRERLEQQKIEKENELLDVKREAIASQKVVEELYTTAITAFRRYSGVEPQDSSGEYNN